MGRPSTFTQSLADEICERIADGESLRAICSDDAMPAKSSVFKWLGQDEAFADQYARAREAQADSLFDDILLIADTTQEGEKIKVGPNGLETTTFDMLEHRKLRVEARKWMAGKLAPKKYGEKQQLEHSGALTLTPTILVNGKPS